MLTITILAGRESFFHDICLFYRASLGGPDERREQKFATLVGGSFRNVIHKYFTHTMHDIFSAAKNHPFMYQCLTGRAKAAMRRLSSFDGKAQICNRRFVFNRSAA